MVATWKEVGEVVDDVVMIAENARRRQTCDRVVGARMKNDNVSML